MKEVCPVYSVRYLPGSYRSFSATHSTYPGTFGAREFTAAEMREIHLEMCIEMRWAIRPWQPVAVELRRLLGGEKSYVWRDGQRLRVYRMPQLGGCSISCDNKRPNSMTEAA